MRIAPFLLAAIQEAVVRIVDALPGPINTARVAAVNTDGTVDLKQTDASTAVTPHVVCLSSYIPTVGDRVRVYSYRGDIFVLGEVPVPATP